VDRECEFTHDIRGPAHRQRVARLAARQFGIVARRQLLALDVSARQVEYWLESAYLYRRLPGVYAVGHVPRSLEANLVTGLLWAGPGAMLSHAFGVWWWGPSDRRPGVIQLSTPRQMLSRPGIRVHGRSELEREWHRGLPVAPLAAVLLQFARTASLDDLRYVLAQADYHDRLRVQEIVAACRGGRRGSRKLNAAMARHLPQLAVTRSEFERRLLFLCEEHDLPIPECNAWIEGFIVDAVWREQKVIVELDGKDGHSPWDRVKRDHHRDLIHRRAGFVTLRYVWDQFENDGDLVAAGIGGALAERDR
jgi:very-short-patch-repair endonuclease